MFGNGSAERYPLVVVAEDDAAVAQVVAAAVSTELGAHVLLAHDGRRLLDLLEEVRPAAVVTDVRMPKTDGLAAVRALRGNPRTAAVPVVAISAAAGKREALAAGCDAFVPKPFVLDELLDALRRYVPDPLPRRGPSGRLVG